MHIKTCRHQTLWYGNAQANIQKYSDELIPGEIKRDLFSAVLIRCISHELYSLAEFSLASKRDGTVCYRMVNGYYKDMQMIFSQRHGKSIVKFLMATKEQFQQFLLSARVLKEKLSRIGCIDSLEVMYEPENLQQNVV